MVLIVKGCRIYTLFTKLYFPSFMRVQNLTVLFVPTERGLAGQISLALEPEMGQ